MAGELPTEIHRRCIQFVLIPGGFRIERMRADKGCAYINEDFKEFYLQTGVSLEYSSTNTPHKIGISEHVGRSLEAMV